MASPPPADAGQDPSVRKCGYLRKQKHGHKRFFVLRGGGEGCAPPPRLEYYESEKKWRNRAAARRVVALDSCLNVNKRADAKHKHLIALYTKDEYFAVAAESEQEQESWFRVLAEAVSESRGGGGGEGGGGGGGGARAHSASALVGFGEASCGAISATGGGGAYAEVWQVTVKPRGLGQSRNLTGVHRLCLSSRALSFVKLNSDVAAVSLQLMNVRRCGHSDSFFFVEVGRSAATGPGELWMQADDAVVAQSIHETVLEAMRAMKELSEFRPRSKSQSSSTSSSAVGGSNPVTMPSRRHHLHNLPPSRTGLPRRTASRGASCRGRTASEGDGTTTTTTLGSPISPGANRSHLSRSNTVTGRPCRTHESSLQHSRSMYLPASRSPPSATSPVCVPSGSVNPDGVPRSAASTSGSPSDAGFISCEECGSSPGEHLRHLLVAQRSSTPESFTDTPPSQDGSDLYGYMIMERQISGGLFQRCQTRRGDSIGDLEKAYRKRTYSLTMPHQKRGPSQISSASLDEYTLTKANLKNGGHSGRGSHAASPKFTYPEDYGDIEIGLLHKGSSGNLGDDGYMPMTPGVAQQVSKIENYMPMSPMCVSAPKQIINPRTQPLTVANGYRTSSPSSCSLEDSGYMRMLCGSRFSVESSDSKLSNSEYLNMSPVDPCVSVTPPDYFLTTVGGMEQPPPLRQPCSYSSLPRCYKPQQSSKNNDSSQYVIMSLQCQKILEEPVKAAPKNAPSPLRQGRADLLHRSRICRPTRLPLDSLRMLPSMNEHPILPEPKSPGEYINIDFSGRAIQKHSPSSTESPASSLSSSSEQRRSPLSDYMNINVSLESPKSGDAVPFSPVDAVPELAACPAQPEEEEGVECYRLTAQVPPSCQAGAATIKDDYTEMTFCVSNSPPQPTSQPTECSQTTSPSSCVRRLNLGDTVPQVESFLLRGTPVDPDRGAKVIRADPQGRRRHSSETFSSTTTVTPVFPSFAHDTRRHGSASVENVSVLARNGDFSDDEYGSPMCRETSAGFQNGLNYIALNLMDEGLAGCDALVRFKAASCCKGGINAIHASPYASLGFKDTATAVKD